MVKVYFETDVHAELYDRHSYATPLSVPLVPATSPPTPNDPGVSDDSVPVADRVPLPQSTPASPDVQVTASTLADVAVAPKDRTPPALKNPHCVLLAANGPRLRADPTPHTRAFPVTFARQTMNSVNGAVMIAPVGAFITSPPSNDSADLPFRLDATNEGELASE